MTDFTDFTDFSFMVSEDTMVIDGVELSREDHVYVNMGSCENPRWEVFQVEYFLPEGYYCKTWKEFLQGPYLMARGFGIVPLSAGVRLARKYESKATLPYGW